MATTGWSTPAGERTIEFVWQRDSAALQRQTIQTSPTHWLAGTRRRCGSDRPLERPLAHEKGHADHRARAVRSRLMQKSGARGCYGDEAVTRARPRTGRQRRPQAPWAPRRREIACRDPANSQRGSCASSAQSWSELRDDPRPALGIRRVSGSVSNCDWRVPRIHENAVLRDDDRDVRRADVAVSLAGGESLVSADLGPRDLSWRHSRTGDPSRRTPPRVHAAKAESGSSVPTVRSARGVDDAAMRRAGRRRSRRETRVGVAAVLQLARRWPTCGAQIADGQSGRGVGIV